MNILSNIFAGVVLFFGSIFAPHALAPTQKLGSVTPIQTQVFFLSGAGINSNATSVLLTSMAYSNGALVNMADLGTIGYATIDPGFPNKEEQVSFSNITQNSNGSALLTGVIRGLAFNPGTQGCNGSSTLAVSHAGGAQFVLSNTACFYTNYAGLSNNNTFTASNTFSNAPTILTPSTNASSAVTYAQLASTSFSGTVNAATSTKGIIQIATNAQIASGTATGSSGALLVEPNSNSSLIASTSIVSVQASGTLDPSFLAGGNYSLGQLTSASTTLNGTTTISNVTSSFLAVNASGTLIATGTPETWQRSVFTASGTIATTSQINVATWTIPYYASTTSIYNFNFLMNSSIGGNAGTSTIQINGSQVNNCNSNGALPNGYSIQFTMLDSTSSESILQGNTAGCNGTASFSNGTFAFSTTTVINFLWKPLSNTTNNWTITSTVSFYQ